MHREFTLMLPAGIPIFMKKVAIDKKVRRGPYQKVIDLSLIENEYKSTRQQTFLPAISGI